ncbi:MAG: SDR family NAD(P)-dependent oxidoreductase, partial [Pseudomonadota bacterium]
AAARAFYAAGANVVLAARTAGDIERIAGELGERALAATCDVADFASVSDAVATGVDTFGSLDIVINNAGLIDPIARIEESDPAAWGHVIDVNVKGVYHVMHAAFAPMRDAGGGVIINISSGAACNALEGWSHYCTSKAAVLMLTMAGHKEWADLGIRTVGLSPGTVATGMQTSIRDSGINPVSKIAWEDHKDPADVAKALMWLATEEARGFDGGDLDHKSSQGRAAMELPPL